MKAGFDRHLVSFNDCGLEDLRGLEIETIGPPEDCRNPGRVLLICESAAQRIRLAIELSYCLHTCIRVDDLNIGDPVEARKRLKAKLRAL
jgi:hypothetical protein